MHMVGVGNCVTLCYVFSSSYAGAFFQLITDLTGVFLYSFIVAVGFMFVYSHLFHLVQYYYIVLVFVL
jgi:hypothetical protein